MNDNKTYPGRKLALTGAFLQFGLLVGMAGTTIGMIRAFDALGHSGIADPKQLAASISTVLIATAVGLVISIVGFVLFGIAIFACGYRAPWCLFLLFVYGCLLVLAFPVGTIFGIVLLVYCHRHRPEFLQRDPQSPTLMQG